MGIQSSRWPSRLVAAMVRGLHAAFVAPRQRSGLHSCGLLAGLCLAGWASIACGAIFPSGDVSPADPSSWTDATTAYIGNTASGALTVNGGSLLRSARTEVYGTVTVDGSRTQWISTGDIMVRAKGRLDISGGAAVVNHTDVSGLVAEGIVDGGGVNITGAGSRWSTDFMAVGYYAEGYVKVTKGGAVFAATGSDIGVFLSTAPSEILIDGPGSTWNTNGYRIWVGNDSLKVTGGGLLASGTDSGVWDSRIGYGVFGSYYGKAKVDGVGSRWLNNSDLRVESGVLSISGGGAVTAANVTVRPSSVLAIDAGRGSSLVVGGGGGTITSSGGFVRLLAGADAASATTATPISAATWSGSTRYQPIGGTWNSTTHEFTVSSVLSGEAGSQLVFDPAATQRLLITDSAKDNAVGVSVLAASTAGTVASVTATEIESGPLATLAGLIGSNQRTLDAWNFAFSGTVPTTANPMYLSFDIGTGYASNDLEVWSYNGTKWTKYDAFDITSNGTWASFSITGAGGYAVVATVPEPGSIALLASALAIGAVTLWRRRRSENADCR